MWDLWMICVGVGWWAMVDGTTLRPKLVTKSARSAYLAFRTRSWTMTRETKGMKGAGTSTRPMTVTMPCVYVCVCVDCGGKIAGGCKQERGARDGGGESASSSFDHLPWTVLIEQSSSQRSPPSTPPSTAPAACHAMMWVYRQSAVSRDDHSHTSWLLTPAPVPGTASPSRRALRS